MSEAFAPQIAPTELHRLLARFPNLPLWVHAWYDKLPQRALAERPAADPLGSWGIVQGISQAEHFGTWVHFFNADGSRREDLSADSIDTGWGTLLYEPLGSVSPAANFLVSDSDYVEVLTEIDIQTPIPRAVQHLRSGRGFLFLGCRFSTQLERIFARQIIKRSCGPALRRVTRRADPQRTAISTGTGHRTHRDAARRLGGLADRIGSARGSTAHRRRLNILDP